jgi:hypothetical protein
MSYRAGKGSEEGRYALLVEQTPPAFDPTKLDILPLLIEHLEEEVADALVVRLAEESIEERLEALFGCR